MGHVNRLTGRVVADQQQTEAKAKEAAKTAAFLVSNFYDNLGSGMPEATKQALTEQFSAPLFAAIGVGFSNAINAEQQRIQAAKAAQGG